ncbi:hypothetical protein ACFLU6_04820 [Acidobacteriota bacterium]
MRLLNMLHSPKITVRIDATYSTKLIYYEGEEAILGIVTDITEWKRTKEALKRSESNWQLLIENMPDVMLKISPEDGTILAINRTFTDQPVKNPD